MTRTILILIRKIGPHNLIMLSMLLIGVNCLSAGLGGIVRGATMSAFFPVATAAALLGWVLAYGRFKSWQAWVGILFMGVFLLTSSTAQLGTPLLALVKLLPSAMYQLFLWTRQRIPLDLSDVAGAWAVLLGQYAQFWGRIASWAQQTMNGTNTYDPVMRVLAWSLLLWPITAWAGWFLRGRQILIGMAPALVLLALVGNYTAADTSLLWGLLSITLLLMGVMRYEANMARWVSHGIDYAEIIQGDTIVAIIVVTSALAVTAWAVPLISIKDITDALRQYQEQNRSQNQSQNNSNKTIAKALGLEQAPAPPDHFAPYGVPSLPNEHLIGAPPELLHTPVMSISTGEMPPYQANQSASSVPYHHWRSTTFDAYTGSGWASSATQDQTYEANVPVFAQIPYGYRVLNQVVSLADQGDGKMYWDGTLYSSDHSFEAGWRIQPASGSVPSADPFRGADILGALSDAKTYRVESLLPVFSVEQLRASPAAYPDLIVGRYLDLPKEIPERVLVLARDLTAVPVTPYDRAKAIETYLRSTYPYTLDVPIPPVGRDLVDYFLFDLKKGYCDYFATAMVVLARAAGLPSRIVIGYANGAYDPVSAKYYITQADAHAWAEVYFSGIGWVEFEPTPNQPGITRPLVGMPPGPSETPTGLKGSIALLLSLPGTLPGWGTLVVLMLTLVMLIAVLQLGEHWLLTRISTTRAIQWIYRGIYRLGRNPTSPPPAGETANEFACALKARLKRLSQQSYLGQPFLPAPDELDLLTQLYLRVMYSTHTPQKSELRQALRAWRGLRWRLMLARIMPTKDRNG
jgi:hypothetical protein